MRNLRTKILLDLISISCLTFSLFVLTDVTLTFPSYSQKGQLANYI